MSNRVEFASAPPSGTVLWLDNQAYELANVSDYRRLDGVLTRVLHWRSCCPDCGLQFAVTSGLVSKSLNRRCADCARPFKPVFGKRRRKVRIKVEMA